MRSDAKENRQDLLAAAARLISEQGDGVSMRVIAQTANVGIGTLYRHFPTRDDLMVGLANSILDGADAVADRFYSSNAAPGPRWRAYVTELAELNLGALAGALRADEHIKSVQPLVGHRDETLARMAVVLDDAKRASLVGDDVTVARFLLGIIQFTRPLPPDAPSELVNELPWLLDAYLRGLARPGTRSDTSSP